jgi:hypothetical protein
MAPLQKRALYELVAMVVLLAVLGLLLILINHGGDGRLLIVAVPIAALCHWVPRHLTRPKPKQPIITDERDKVILGNVPRYQRFGIILAVFVWIAVIVFRADAHGQMTVSLFSLMLLLWSVFIADAVFSVVGTMIEYWRTK